jgi:UDP:flavonoid glycosyltransferase YjiC (YdhE family)
MAFPEDRLPNGLDLTGVTICAAPRWGQGGPLLERSTRSTASLGDALAQIGLQSSSWVKTQIARWRELFDRYRPQVIVSDYAPGAVLAARDRVPCIASGVGFTVPPANLRTFPPLHDGLGPIYPEEDVCDAVNRALTAHDIRPISFLPEALTGDAQCVCTIPLLDPYDAKRTEPVVGPQLNTPIVRRNEYANQIFCYLREAPGANRLESMVDCLLGLPNAVTVFSPGLAEAARTRLSNSGIEVLDRPAILAKQLMTSRLVVHYGGHGIAAAALLAGVPQVILDFDIEKSLIAAALQRRGVACRFDYYQSSVDAVRQGITRALGDPIQLAAATEAALEHDVYRDRDVTSEIATVCERLAV